MGLGLLYYAVWYPNAAAGAYFAFHFSFFESRLFENKATPPLRTHRTVPATPRRTTVPHLNLLTTQTTLCAL